MWRRGTGATGISDLDRSRRRWAVVWPASLRWAELLWLAVEGNKPMMNSTERRWKASVLRSPDEEEARAWSLSLTSNSRALRLGWKKLGPEQAVTNLAERWWGLG